MEIREKLNEWVQSGAPLLRPGVCVFCSQQVGEDEAGSLVLNFEAPSHLVILGIHLECAKNAHIGLREALERPYDEDDDDD